MPGKAFAGTMPASRRYPEQSAMIGYVLLEVQQQLVHVFYKPYFKNMSVSTTCFLLYGGVIAIEHLQVLWSRKKGL